MIHPSRRRRNILFSLLAPADPAPRGFLSWLLLNLAVAVAYSIAGLVVVLFGIGPAKISPIYPPAGIAVAATFILGPRILPAVFIGQFLNGFPLLELPQTTWSMYALVNTGTGAGSILEALIAVAVLRHFAGTWHPFDRARDVVVFLIGSCLAAALVCGAIGTLSLRAGGFVPDGELAITFVTFFFADAAGIAVFGALVLAWYRKPQLDQDIVMSSAAIMTTVLLIASVGVWSRYPVDYLFLPLLLWAGFRAGSRGVTLAAATITVVTILATIQGAGSFVGKTANESILLLEGFMAVITFTGLLIVAVRAQQLAADAALEAYNRVLEQRVAERTAEVGEKNRQLEEKQARIDDDLKTAQILQASILPTDFSGYARTGIAAFMKPALEVGGDFYDVFPLESGRLGLVVADVSGKGVAAAFFMAVTRTMLRSVALAGAKPAACLGRVNEALCRENPIDMFVTALYAELDEASGVVSYVNAGHCEPIIMRAGGETQLLRRSGNPPLGVMEKAFVERSFTLAPGEMLFLYTDGVTEASNRDGDQSRVGRLMDIARQFAGHPPQELMLAVIGGVESFSAGTVQADDITCLVIRRNAAVTAESRRIALQDDEVVLYGTGCIDDVAPEPATAAR
jgi:serine phosphatase RsbU (regulator of sigma subunit)